MLGCKGPNQLDFFVADSLKQLVPENHILASFDCILDLAWQKADD